MGWFGKIMGGTLGLLVGGPLGALAGATLGHIAFDKTDEAPGYAQKRLSGAEQVQAAYFISLFSVLGKFTKIDGVVSRSEIAAVEKFIGQTGITGAQRDFALNIFNDAKNSPYAIADFAGQFYDVCRQQPALLYSFIDLLFQTALADGTIHPLEEKAIDDMRRIFGISDAEYSGIKGRYIDDAEKYYKALNCTAACTEEEIKKQYRKLAKDFHPDTIIAKGLPEEFVAFATKKFQDIQEAYEKIRKERGF